MTDFFPARLHVLLAREGGTGVVIRRGPSKHVCTVRWDRQNDTFVTGQWLHGRIYERRSDLSPDGKCMIYFAMNGKWAGSAKGSWTAISKAPYLKALCLWPKGDCWNGGGLFTGRRQYWLNGHDPDRPQTQTCRELQLDRTFSWHESYGGECPGVYYIRLQRDGWTLCKTEHLGKWRSATVWEKPLNPRWTLRKTAREQVGSPPGKGCYFEEHELVDSRTGEATKYHDWEWADLDGDRLVWAQEGRLFASALATLDPARPQLLQDFNDMEFEPIAAPY